MILLRTTGIDERALQFADRLESASNLPVAFLFDGRGGSSLDTSRLQVALKEQDCSALGLFCPPDFAWRCGDYGFYIARKRFPDAASYWMIEYDVRFGGGKPEEFFSFFAEQTSVDLLAAYFQPVERSYWYWEGFARSRDHRPYRCLFPLVRLSPRAVDALLSKRVKHSRQLLRRNLWPNDESFVATTLANGDFTCRDLNDFGQTFYDEQTFSFERPIRGELFAPGHSGIMIYHPVLFGDSYSHKLAALESYKRRQRDPLQMTVARKLSRYTKW